MMKISKGLEEWLNDVKIQDMINKGKFQELFKLAVVELGEMSNELAQLINIFKILKLDSNLKNHIGPILDIISEVIDQKVIFIGWNYEYPEDKVVYSRYEGTEFIIRQVEALDLVDDSEKDKHQIFNDILWWVESTRDYRIQFNVYGSSLKLIKTLGD